MHEKRIWGIARRCFSVIAFLIKCIAVCVFFLSQYLSHIFRIEVLVFACIFIGKVQTASVAPALNSVTLQHIAKQEWPTNVYKKSTWSLSQAFKMKNWPTTTTTTKNAISKCLRRRLLEKPLYCVRICVRAFDMARLCVCVCGCGSDGCEHYWNK